MPRFAPLELLTPAEMAAADARAIAAGIPGERLMAAAGQAVARAIRRRFRPARTLVLAGPGNNGGDGYVVARLLHQAGWPVAVAPLAPPVAGTDAAAAAALWRGPLAEFSPAEAIRAGLVVDALFGAGLTRPVEGCAAATLAAVRGPLVAIDLPSGVNGETGAVLGFARQAALTVTFVRWKPGHLLLPGRDLCGEAVLADIGLPDAGQGARAWRNAPGVWFLPQAAAEQHKYSRGHLTLLGGPEMSGAARLAAGAARRAGAGLVTIAVPDAAAAAAYAGTEPGVIIAPASLAALLADSRRQVWLLGPGLPGAPGTLLALRQLIAAGRQVVVDAGGLTAAAGRPDLLAGAAILTPHAGEFLRVFGDPGADRPAADRPAAARRAAARTGAVIVLKGSDTLIAAPDGRLAINANAPPTLATAGSGDVLAGAIAALLTQGMPPFEAAAAGVWLHGEAARLHGPGLLAEDLIPLLPNAIARAAKAVAADEIAPLRHPNRPPPSSRPASLRHPDPPPSLIPTRFPPSSQPASLRHPRT